MCWGQRGHMRELASMWECAIERAVQRLSAPRRAGDTGFGRLDLLDDHHGAVRSLVRLADEGAELSGECLTRGVDEGLRGREGLGVHREHRAEEVLLDGVRAHARVVRLHVAPLAQVPRGARGHPRHLRARLAGGAARRARRRGAHARAADGAHDERHTRTVSAIERRLGPHLTREAQQRLPLSERVLAAHPTEGPCEVGGVIPLLALVDLAHVAPPVELLVPALLELHLRD